MLQPIKIIIIMAACTLLPVINESRSFAESADRKKAYKSRAKAAFKSSATRQSRSSRSDKKQSRTINRKVSQPKVSSKNKSSKLQSRSSRSDKKQSRTITRKASQPKVSSKNKSSKQPSRSLRNDEKRSDPKITRKANRPQVSSQNKAQRKLKSPTAKSRRDRDNGKQPIATISNEDRGELPILKLPGVNPDADRDRGKRSIGNLPIGKPLVDKIPIDKRTDKKIRDDKRKDDKRKDDKRKDDKRKDDKRKDDKRKDDKRKDDKRKDDKRKDDKRKDDKRRDDELRDDKRKDDKRRDDKRRADRRRRGSENPNLGLKRFDDVLRDRVGRKRELRRKINWKDRRGRLSRIRSRSSYYVGIGLTNQYRRSRGLALRNLMLGSRCHWWLDFVVGHCWDTYHYHWWDYCETPGYWDCWTPCHFRVIHCPPSPGIVATTWYFGIDCILVPDLSAYGIQKVNAGSPAEMAGLVVGDMIVGINGNSITSEFELSEAITASEGHLDLDVIRDGADSPVEIHVDLARLAVQSY